eukprot:scaffold1788_cov396-Prasinococcus_capsulatus_cf.AAC.12
MYGTALRCRRVDVSGQLGKRTPWQITLRGGTSPTRVKLYAENSCEIETPTREVALEPGNLNHINLAFNPAVEGQCDSLVNIVDVSSLEVVSSVLVRTQARTHFMTSDSSPGKL